MAWHDILDQPLPRDEEAERCLLGAVLVSDDAATPDEDLASLSIVFEVMQPTDFGDPFYAWLFALIGEARRVWQTLDKQLAFILARPNQQRAQQLGVKHLALELARLLVTREGASCSGLVSSIRKYCNRLREVKDYRENIEAALAGVRREYERWERASRPSD